MLRRLAPKLILALGVIILLVKVVSVWIDVRRQEAQLIESMTLGADQLSRSITSATWHAMLADTRQDAYEVMQTIAQKQGIEQIRMFNRSGRLMFSTRPSDNVHLDRRDEVCAPCHKRAAPLVNVDMPSRVRVYRNDRKGRAIAMITPIYNESACSQAACHAHPAEVKVLGVLDVTLDAQHVDDDLRALRSRAVLVTGIEMGLIGMFLVFFTRRFVERPILKLIEGTKAVSDMKLDKPISIRSSEELEQLANSFNVMRERLQQAVDENVEFTQHLESKVEERTAQLKNAQQKLIQTDRLASLGQLAASVAHEINNPISGVLNLSMLMQRIIKDDGIPPNRVADVRRYLGQVSSETSRVGRIVSDLLAFSRRSKPQQKDADINALIRTTVSLVSHKLQLANVQADLQLEESLPSVRCDGSQVQQVVMNLILNGAEAIKGGGVVHVRTSTEPDRSGVVLEVSDTGSGIPPELIDKIFNPFFTTKEDGKGVGLGLAVVYGIVQAHGGEIEVSSVVGHGTTFRVRLPLTPLDATPPPSPDGHDGSRA
ncbi:MAG: ATP-binding protein [Thermoanaerobaculia bacterium]